MIRLRLKACSYTRSYTPLPACGWEEDAACGRVPPVRVSSVAVRQRRSVHVLAAFRIFEREFYSTSHKPRPSAACSCAFRPAWTAPHGWRCWLTRHVLRQTARRSAARGPCGAPLQSRWARCRRTAAGRSVCLVRCARASQFCTLVQQPDASCREGRRGAYGSIRQLRAERLPRAGLGVRRAPACVACCQRRHSLRLCQGRA